MDTRLYSLHVAVSVGWLIGPSVHHIIDVQVVFALLPLPWPTVRDWGAVYPTLLHFAFDLRKAKTSF